MKKIIISAGIIILSISNVVAQNIEDNKKNLDETGNPIGMPKVEYKAPTYSYISSEPIISTNTKNRSIEIENANRHEITTINKVTSFDKNDNPSNPKSVKESKSLKNNETNVRDEIIKSNSSLSGYELKK